MTFQEPLIERLFCVNINKQKGCHATALFILIPDRKETNSLRGYFSQDKAKDAARLTPCKDDNALLRKIDRKDCLLFIRY